MKNFYKTITIVTITILTVVVLSVVPKSHAAGTAVFGLSPGSGSYVAGSSFTVTVYEDSGSTTINAVKAVINYDDNKLEFTDQNALPPTSDFGIKASASGGGGVVTFQM